ncbi:spore coat protein [Thermohalobacter berrensis]|uniref:Spore coat protein n=1 Tax=Thermohalobacter berrensis TaxID=99594 RepID=A0A419SUZ4_9FIRM|nr:spore coat protein [Thermohalobacter berrensis]RKD29044.1 hypothetical protein BET03_06800 [Thermohalobacter berrensis]
MYLYNSYDSLTEREILNDLIMSEKHLSMSYNNAIVESPCPVLRKIFSECLSNTQNIEYSIYDAIEKRGWNNNKLVSEREVKNILKRYELTM